MNKVIRTAKISDKSVRLADYHREEVRSIPLDDSPEEEAGIELEAQVDEEGELVLADGPEGEADGDTVESAEEEETAGEADGDEAQNVTEVPEEEGHLTYTASQAEELVQERVKEFEARFQQEKEEAQRSGHEAGKAEGYKEGKADSEKEVEGLRSLVEDLQLQWEDHYKNTDQWIVDLALAIAEKVVGVTVENNREPVLETVRSCLDDLRQDAEVVIKINPEDAEVIRENQDHWLRAHQVDKPVIKEDPTVNRGGCIVETQTGDVDAQIEEQMSKLRAALVDAIRSGNDSE